MENEQIKAGEIIELDLATVEESDVNPRLLPPRAYKALKESLHRFGDVGVLVWNKRTNRIVGGNKRLNIMKDSGIKKAAARVVDLSEEEEMALLIELNNQASMGVWDVEKASEKIQKIKLERPDLFDALNMGQLYREITKGTAPKREPGMSGVIPDMEIQPFEHWDYVVLVFKDSRDWLAAIDFLGIGKVKTKPANSISKIGLGRCIDGAKFLELVGAKK
jgi:hypothetical protein